MKNRSLIRKTQRPNSLNLEDQGKKNQTTSIRHLKK